MAKIPFDIKYRPQIESGEYKIETRNGKPVRIICWDRLPKKGNDDDLNLCVLVPQDEGEAVYYYHRSGKSRWPDDRYDLFIVTPEPELTEFEKVVRDALEYDPEVATEEEIVIDVKEYATELLSLAREQFIKDGYIIEKKAFHDAVEKVSPEVMKEVSENIGQLDPLEQYRKGREDALKDLPRWRKYSKGTEIDPFALVRFSDGSIGRSKYASEDCYVLEVKDMLKLPGFKED